jgi:uncharacterized membrane protein (UPF0127 family)
MRSLFAGLLVLIIVHPLAAQYARPRALAVFPGDVRLSLEVAADERTRQRGLMYRKAMAPTEGMIFIFEEKGYYPFWMKNTLISLDLFWLDERGTIVSIQHAVPPCGNVSELDSNCPMWDPTPGTTALYVIETVAGFAKQHGLEVGQQVKLSGLP